MDTNNHTQLIARLKRQPRHGAGIPTPEDVLNLAAGTAGLASLSAAYAKLYEQQSLTVRGLDAFIGIQEKLNQAFLKSAGASLSLEIRNKDLNKAFGLNSISAAKLSDKLQGVAKDLKIAGIQAQQYAINIKKMLPTLDQMAAADSKQYKGLMRVQQVMTTNLGLTADQAEKYMGYAGQRGKDAEATLTSQFALSQAIEQTTGDIGAFKMISEGIAETSEDVQLQYGKMPGNLALAIVKAKTLGFTMENLKSAADNLLNIESSIGQELEYQLLSGHRLVDVKGKSLTNAYREAALQGDANKQADTLNTILEQEGETLSNNLFARQQMSQLLGMDEAALARALQKKSILEDLPGGDALFDKTGDELMAAAAAMGADGDQMKKLLDNQDTRTTDQKMLQEMEMLTDVMIKTFAPDQAKAVAGARNAAMLGTAEVGYDTTNLGTAEAVGAVKYGLGGANAITNTATFGAELVQADSMVVQSMSVASGTGVTPTGLAAGGIVPAGFPNDTYPALLTSGETVVPPAHSLPVGNEGALANTMLQVGAMIVAAIKSGGINLNERYSV